MFTLFASFNLSLAADAASVVTHTIPEWAKGNTVFETFFRGGPVMYPIVAVLVVAVAVILAKTNGLVDDSRCSAGSEKA